MKKQKKNRKKLVLNKKTISNLNTLKDQQMRVILGADGTDSRTVVSCHCSDRTDCPACR